MEPKDFAMREAEHLDFSYRLAVHSTMELFIETLTGTCFELRVSPYETIITVKAKIQQLEGIPVSQQYLIWQNVELEDDYCLHDYNITDGCTLKLVLAMRGGPINTRRIAMEDPTFSEMADFFDSRDDEFEKLSPPPSGGNGSKQVTLLVYRDGDHLNFFRVVDRGDGTLTPFSESLSGSACNLREGEDEDDDDTMGVGGVRRSSSHQPLSVAQMVENNVTAAKMKEIRSQMQNLHLNNTSNLKKRPLLSSINKAPLPLELKPKPSRSKSIKAEIKTELDKLSIDALDIGRRCGGASPKLPRVDKLPIPPVASRSKEAERISSPTTLNRDTSHTNIDHLVPGSTPRRAQLKRMKHVESSQEVLEEMKPPNDDKFVSGDTKIDSVKEDRTIPNLKDTDAKTENKQDSQEEIADDTSGRFSPRTRRLLNALENSSDQRKATYPAQTTAYRSPRSTMLQGMTFNRHDMYLRSYGLIPSPDDVEDRVTSSASGETPPPVQIEEAPISSKVFETTHGVKYSALPAKPTCVGSGNRLLKTPPNWIVSKDTVAQSGQTWHPAPQPPLTGGPVRNSERILRPPSTTRQNITSKPFHQKTYFDSTTARSKNFDKEKPETSFPRQWQKLDSLHLPQPPPSASTSLAPPTWQKQRLRRLNSIKQTANDDNNELMNIDGHCKDPLLNTRRSYASAANKSTLRKKESPHGKVESMSREEAREMVDFINKAVDASILRTLVRSPVKDGKRGSSGQNTHRLGGTTLQTPLSGIRGGSKLVPGPPTLPPVKPTTKKKRCFLCAKRTGLASSYVCRCGNNFCATHRYAESHNCTYDYKTSGRKLLEETNPLVSAPKLPKI